MPKIANVRGWWYDLTILRNITSISGMDTGPQKPLPPDEQAEHNKETARILRERLVSPGATDSIYDEIQKKIEAGEDLDPKQQEVLNALDQRFESRNPPYADEPRAYDAELEAQKRQKILDEREKQAEIDRALVEEKKRAFVKNTTVTPRPPTPPATSSSEKIPDLPAFTQPTRAPKKEKPNEYQIFFRGLLKWLSGKK